MTGMVRHAALAMLVAMTAMSTLVPLAEAQENCDRYGFLALKQARENEKRKCGNSGPRWTTDLDAHVAWCRSVGPMQWQAELREREKALAECKQQ
jgi:hypothetical protein